MFNYYCSSSGVAFLVISLTLCCCSSRLPSNIWLSSWQLVAVREESQITAKAKVSAGLCVCDQVCQEWTRMAGLAAWRKCTCARKNRFLAQLRRPQLIPATTHGGFCYFSPHIWTDYNSRLHPAFNRSSFAINGWPNEKAKEKKNKHVSGTVVME